MAEIAPRSRQEHVLNGFAADVARIASPDRSPSDRAHDADAPALMSGPEGLCAAAPAILIAAHFGGATEPTRASFAGSLDAHDEPHRDSGIHPEVEPRFVQVDEETAVATPTAPITNAMSWPRTGGSACRLARRARRSRRQ